MYRCFFYYFRSSLSSWRYPSLFHDEHNSIAGFFYCDHPKKSFIVIPAGFIITETTTGNFQGYDTAGIPEFIRARTPAQYSASLDVFGRIIP